MYSILLQVLRANWYIDPDFAQGAGFLVSQLLKGQLTLEGDSEKFKPSINKINFSSPGGSSTEKHSAVISISGPLFKHDQYCGPVGMDSIGKWIRNLDADPGISSIILKLSTPGGTVEGTAQLGEVIKSTNKPILAFIDEMACSAGYWLASQCDEIVAATTRAQVGSIGVMLSFADMKPYWEKEGVVFHEIYSSLSSDKNKDFKDLLDGKYENYRKDVLDVLANDFISAVKSSREITDESILKGRVVFADKAIDIGLVDSIGTLEDAINRSLELSENNNTNTQQSNNLNVNSNQISFEMKKFPLLQALLEMDEIETTQEGMHLSEDNLQSVEDSLSTAENAASQSTDLQASIDNLTQTVSERDQKISELETEISQLQSVAGDDPAIISSLSEKEKSDDIDPMLRELNATENTLDRISIMRKYGYGS